MTLPCLTTAAKPFSFNLVIPVCGCGTRRVNALYGSEGGLSRVFRQADIVTVVPMRQIHRRDSLAGLSHLCDVILEDMAGLGMMAAFN